MKKKWENNEINICIRNNGNKCPSNEKKWNMKKFENVKICEIMKKAYINNRNNSNDIWK
jgi:hypothetical protein